jgi:hypothetical protein
VADLSPSDAVVALRSFPRRFAALGSAGSDPDDDDGPTPSPEALAMARATAAGEASAAAAEVASAGEAMRRLLIEDNPTLDRPTPTPTPAATLEDAVSQLTAAIDPVAALASSASGQDWKRTGTVDGNAVTALDLLRDAVDAGAHHLRAAAS